jgi:hypothetical protein
MIQVGRDQPRLNDPEGAGRSTVREPFSEAVPEALVFGQGGNR